MKIPELGIQKPANIVLGAGSSRGASCFENAWVASPLDTDFFEQLERLRNTPDGKSLEDLVAFARSEFGSNPPRMELFFTQIESLSEFHQELNITRGPTIRQYEKVLERFPSDLATVFRTLRRATNLPELTCSYHEVIAAALDTSDTIISFNYDCIFDEALRSRAGKKWDAESGYGTPVDQGADRWHDHTGQGRPAKKTIQLLKVHGSLNWNRTTEATVSLRLDPYAKETRHPGEIVAPVWNKRVTGDRVLSPIWKAARQALGRGPVLVLIGYSIPDTDLLSQSLLRVATSESGKKLSHLIIVNPSPSDRAKTRTVLSKALTEKTNVIEFSYLHEFIRVL